MNSIKYKKTAGIIFILLMAICVSIFTGCSDTESVNIPGSRDGKFRAIVEKTEGSTVTVKTYEKDEDGTRQEYAFDNRQDDVLSAGNIIVITYTKVRGTKLTVKSWYVDTFNQVYEETDPWIDEEYGERVESYEAVTVSNLQITGIYRNCFFATTTLDGLSYTVKINTMLSDDFFAGDIVTADLTNIYKNNQTGRMEADTTEVTMNTVVNA